MTKDELIREALKEAYEQGCVDTHRSIQNEPSLALMREEDCEFGEAADDYAASVFPRLVDALEEEEAAYKRGWNDRAALSNIARRVAMKALATTSPTFCLRSMQPGLLTPRPFWFWSRPNPTKANR